jgi:hypothetical protein
LESGRYTNYSRFGAGLCAHFGTIAFAAQARLNSMYCELFIDVSSWQCAPKARIISGGGFQPDSCRLNPEAGERLGRVTDWVGAS